MAQAQLSAVEACVFDAYGTLFDFASAARACEDIPRDAAERLTALWRDKQLQYTWLRAAQDRHADFWRVTADALDFAMETLGIGNARLRDRLMSLYLELDVFPEVPSVLRQLKAAGLRTAILSNGTPAMLEAAVKRARIDGLIDSILSVEEVGAYKPHPKVYQLAVDRLSVPASAMHSNRRMRGTPMRPRRSACRWFGATATVSAGSDSPVPPIARSPRSRNCRRSCRRSPTSLRRRDGSARDGVTFFRAGPY